MDADDEERGLERVGGEERRGEEREREREREGKGGRREGARVVGWHLLACGKRDIHRCRGGSMK